jgi:polar amino acid transport system substrate-binding protein
MDVAIAANSAAITEDHVKKATLLPVLGMALFGVAAALTGAPVEAKEWKTVRIGMDATYPPFESVNAKGEIVGWEVDYARELCKRMKVECTFQNQDWDGIIPSLLAGKFDMIMSSMNITAARKERVNFSDFYFSTPPVFVGAASYKGEFTPAALKGKTIGTQSSTTFANYLEKFYKDSQIKLYPSGDEPQIDLASGRIDFAVTDVIVATTFVEKNAGCCKIIGEIDRAKHVDVFGPGVGAALRKEDTELLAMVNKAIAEVDADGAFKKIADQYFKVNIRGK